MNHRTPSRIHPLLVVTVITVLLLLPTSSPPMIPTARAAFTCPNPWPLRRGTSMVAPAGATRLNYIATHFELTFNGFGSDIAAIRRGNGIVTNPNPNFRAYEYNSITDNYVPPWSFVEEHNWLMANAATYGVTDPEDVYLHYSQDTTQSLQGTVVTVPGWQSDSPKTGATATSRDQARVTVYYPTLVRRVPNFATPQLRALYRAYQVSRLQTPITGSNGEFWSGFMFDNAAYRFLATNITGGGQVTEAGDLVANSSAFYTWYYYQGFGLFEKELREWAATNPPELQGRSLGVMPNIANIPGVTESAWEQAYVDFHPGDILLKEFQHSATREFGRTLPATIFQKNRLAQAAGIDLFELGVIATTVVPQQGSYTTDEAMMNNLGLHWVTRTPNVIAWNYIAGVHTAAWDNNMRGIFDTDLGQPLEDPQVLTTGTDGHGYAYNVYSRRFSCGLAIVRQRGDYNQDFDASTAVTVTLPGNYIPLDADGNAFPETNQATLRNGQALMFLSSTVANPPCTPAWLCTDWSQCSAGNQTRTCSDQNNCGTDNGRPAESQACTCTENWTCSAWSACTDGNQSRTCTDQNSCGTTTNRPPLTQACTCAENWSCGTWSACTNNSQSRTCTDANACGTTTTRPALNQSCDSTPPAAVTDLRA